MSSESLPETPLEFSGVDTVLNPSAGTDVPETLWQCPTCHKTLKTRTGFVKHCLLHRLKNTTEFLHEKLQLYLHPNMEETLSQIKVEPSPDKDFRVICDILLNLSDDKFSFFLLDLSSTVIDIILERRSVLLNRFVEDCQQSFFLYLDSNGFVELMTQLKFIVGEGYSDTVLNVFLFRVCTVFFEKCLTTVLKLMRGGKELVCDVELHFSEQGKVNFLSRCGKILRSLLKGGLDSKNYSLWQSRAEVLCHRFVCRTTSVSTEDFLNESFWDGADEDSKISLSNNAITFFEGLEKIVKQIVLHKGQVVVDQVWDLATKPGNCSILDCMSALTMGYLSENNVIDIFSDVMKCFVFMSCNLEAQHIKTEYDCRGNLNVVALRTSLKRNPTKSKSGNS